MRRTATDVRTLERLMPSEHGLTVFDADTQETSYGICFFDGIPYIFDTHRKDREFVATIELLTEMVDPVRIPSARVRAFSRMSRRRGLLPIPYSGCFFKGNLHVYSFSGPVRGFDLAAGGRSVEESERRLQERMANLWPEVPREIDRAQRELLRGSRRVRHAEDLEVLDRRCREARRSRKA